MVVHVFMPLYFFEKGDLYGYSKKQKKTKGECKSERQKETFDFAVCHDFGRDNASA